MATKRDIEAALLQIAKLSRKQALEDAFALTAQRLFQIEQKEVLRLVAELGPEAALEALDRLQEEVWQPRWEAAFEELMRESVKAQTKATNGTTSG